MQRQLFSFLALSFLISSCSQFHTGRSYLSEMQDEDQSYFNPHRDFPVMAGDNGEWGMTQKDFQNRVPASVEDQENRRGQSALVNELRGLEERQSEDALAFYEKNKTKLGNTSERIYFLKLPKSERREYLSSRGLLDEPRQEFRHQMRKEALENSEVALGMRKDDVVSSLGKPLRVEVAGNPNYENERWVYNVHGSNKYIYFESGEVQGWE